MSCLHFVCQRFVPESCIRHTFYIARQVAAPAAPAAAEGAGGGADAGGAAAGEKI